MEVEIQSVAKPVKCCRVEEENRECVVDLGSDCSIIQEKVARHFSLKLKETSKTLSGFNGTVVIPLGCTRLRVYIDNILFEIKVFVVRDDELTSEIIIGRDVLGKVGSIALVDASGVTFTVNKPTSDANVHEVNLVSTVALKPIEKSEINCDESDPEVLSRLCLLLNKYRKNVAVNISELGCTTAGEMKIELISDEPVYRRPYRMSQADRNKVQEIVDDLERNGIIRDSTSPYASPVVLVRKKNGETRLAIDYRGLNKITKRINYPLPIIDDQIDQLVNRTTFISLDLKSGFYQIPMHSESVKFTAFITPDGQWEFLRMPFGLANAPAVFQKTMNKVLK